MKGSLVNQSGQEFSVFRLLIAFIMGLAILLIILAAVKQFDEYKYALSQKRMYEGFHSAVQSPNGDVIIRRELRFRADSFLSAGSLSSQEGGFDPECIISVSAPESPSTTNINSSAVKFLQNITTTVYFRCIRSFSGRCVVECEVSVKEPFS